MRIGIVVCPYSTIGKVAGQGSFHNTHLRLQIVSITG